jgi:uncharacterized protein
MQNLWSNLLGQCRSYPSLLVAFSGGVDSALLARAAGEAVEGPVLLVFCRSPLVTVAELEQARGLAELLDLPFYVADVDVLALPEVAFNRLERCYVCKRALFSHLWQLARERGLAQVADGSNADDVRSANRPGLKACKELNIAQPLAAAGLGKAQVRALSAWLNLPNHQQAARPCLATRFPYDTALSPQMLLKVAKGEQLLTNLGCKEFRLRAHNNICRIEAAAEEQNLIMSQAAKIESALTAQGWSHVTMDLIAMNSEQ